MSSSTKQRLSTALCTTLVLSHRQVAALQPMVRWRVAGPVARRLHARSAYATVTVERREAPPLVPSVEAECQLELLNSLTQEAEPFVPIDERLVKWYICGPTVYDSAHIGHARNYVAFDIVRRVMLDYFGFDVLYVMNITDIDDKIILRTHRNHLEAMLAAMRTQAVEAVEAELGEARALAERALSAQKPELPALLEAQRALRSAAAAAGLDAPAECDVQEAFTKLTAAFEREFFDDMAALNVLPPDAVTRVSDYVPEIIAYIETILANGYCYEANGSVYFDTTAFSAAGMRYGKLDPSKVGDAELLAEGEGALSAASALADKRHPADFVLWKASKEGEPQWDSPWGCGRPGWHIECSAMASDVLGSRVDLNAGGADLKFPHHENQMAQAEAHFNCCGWVNYFLHSGHLQIEGRKMSKSLKNFVTIEEVLREYRPQAVRFLFLLHKYHEPMEYSENTMAAAADLERRFASFSASLRTRLREAAVLERSGEAPTHKWAAEERTLSETLRAKRAAVDAALRASIDTPAALKALEQLIRAANTYMGAVDDTRRGATLLASVSRYFHAIMGCFGVNFSAELPAAAAGGATGGAASPIQLATALSEFRDAVRQQAIAASKGGDEAEALPAELLALCDSLRDGVLPPLGVKLDDRPSGVAQLALEDPAILVAEAERAKEAAARSEAVRQAKLAEKQARADADAARAAVPPAIMFSPEHDELFERDESFGGLDEAGLPTLDASGTPLSKSARKKLAKQMEKHRKLHEAAPAAVIAERKA